MLRLRQNELAVTARGHGEFCRSAECAWDDVICGKLLALVMAPEAAHRTETDRHNLSLYRLSGSIEVSFVTVSNRLAEEGGGRRNAAGAKGGTLLPARCSDCTEGLWGSALP